MLKLGLVVAAAFVLQIVLSSIQMRHFAKEFTAMRRRGRVACGRQAGGFHAGAIVLFLLDGAGVIQEGKMLMGVTCFARVGPLPWAKMSSGKRIFLTLSGSVTKLLFFPCQMFSGVSIFHSHNLRNNSNRDFFGRLPSKVQADRSIHLIKLFLCKAFFFQPSKQCLNLF